MAKLIVALAAVTPGHRSAHVSSEAEIFSA